MINNTNNSQTNFNNGENSDSKNVSPETVKLSDYMKDNNQTPNTEKVMPSTTPAINMESGSSSDTTKPKKKFNLKMILGVIVLLFIVIGSGVGFYLSQQTQDLRQQASTTCGCQIVGSGADRGCWCEQGGWQRHVAEGSCKDAGIDYPSCKDTANKCDGWADPNSCHQRQENSCFYQCNSSGSEWKGPYGPGCTGTCDSQPVGQGDCKDFGDATSCNNKDDNKDCSWISCANKCFPSGTSNEAAGCSVCSYPVCDAKCSLTSCSVSCQSGSNCSTGKNTFVCRGETGSACGEAHGSYLPELSKSRPQGSVGTITKDMWCTTVQIDSWARNNDNKQIEESGAEVIVIGNNGKVCKHDDTACINADPNFWNCNPEPVACNNLTGTLKTGPITDLNTPLSYNITYKGDDVTKVELVAHGSFTPPAMNTGWINVSTDPSLDGTLTGNTTYGSMVDKLVTTGHSREKLLSEGITYYVNVWGPKGFCDGSGKWTGTGETCTLNPLCNGKVQLPAAPMCLDIGIYDEAGNEIPSSSLSVGQVVKFQCTADKTDSIHHYEFEITKNGVVDDTDINPPGSASRSLGYEITENGDFEAKCRICKSATECDDYLPIN